MEVENNFYCDSFLTGERKLIKFDTEIVNFGLRFKTRNISKTHKIASIFFKKKFEGDTPGSPLNDVNQDWTQLTHLQLLYSLDNPNQTA